MESESKRRSGSFGSQKTVPLSSDEARRLSLSEGSIVDKESSAQSNVSPESSEAGTLKKPRKFKPRKFIAKTFKRKKSEKSKDEQDQNTADSGLSEQESSRKSSVVAKLTEKLSSPKLNRFNLMKRFSGRRSYQVTPMNDDAVEDGSMRKLSSLSVSESSLRNEDAQSEPSTELLDFEEKEEGFVAFEEQEPAAASKETVTLESKKVQLKITISGKKVEKRATPSPTSLDQAIDKASPEAAVTSEPILRRTDIILPLSSTQVRLSAGRDQFLSEMFSPNDQANVEHELKPIRGDSASSFAAVVKDGLSVKPARAEGSNEVEKYLILTSSLNSIISAAKELDDLSSKVENLKFPELGELKIHEGLSETEETPATGSEVKSEPSEDIAEGPKPVIENIIEPEVANNFVESSAKTTNLSDALASSTPIGAESEEEEDEMKKQNKKSKIPRKASLTDVEKLTVHTQEPQKPYNVTLSSSSSEEFKSPTGELKPDEIKFEVGTPVRPLRTSSASGFAPLAIPEPISNADAVQDSVDEVFHSPKSESSLSSVTTRRKIAYVPQLTIYTAEEQEILKSHIEANATESFDTSSLPPDSSVFPTFDDSVGNTMTSSPDKREYLYKILVIGELGTGKTSFIKRYVHQFFSTNYRATIGVDFALKVLQWDTSTTIRLQLWDIAGQERFGNMTRVYYKEAVGAFIVFDVTRSATFDAAIKWKQDLDTKVQLPDGSPIPCILLANKCDQQKQGLVTMPAKMDEYCKQNGFAGWFETSAKDNLNIEESAKALVSKILFNDKLIQNELDGDRLVLNADDPNNPKKKFCSC